ncbi:dephospho-CoA kinase-domain-containing protein [Pisolithus thermaeus]|nr:dephospho-CoA kinase-domain-containing protein [Pisolithus thermaeus]
MCVIDVPLLIEGGLWKWLGCVVVVYCSPESQLRRLMDRDQCTRAEAEARLGSQLPITPKITHADIVIDNSGLRSKLGDQIRLCSTRLDRTVGRTWVISWLFPPLGLPPVAWTHLSSPVNTRVHYGK